MGVGLHGLFPEWYREARVSSMERTPSTIVCLTLLATPFCWRVRDGGLIGNPFRGKVLLESIADVLPSIVWPEMDDLLA